MHCHCATAENIAGLCDLTLNIVMHASSLRNCCRMIVFNVAEVTSRCEACAWEISVNVTIANSSVQLIQILSFQLVCAIEIIRACAQRHVHTSIMRLDKQIIGVSCHQKLIYSSKFAFGSTIACNTTGDIINQHKMYYTCCTCLRKCDLHWVSIVLEQPAS